MRVIKDRIITETVCLLDCEPGDIISFQSRFCTKANSVSGDIVIVKIKKIPKNKIQLKYKSSWVWRNRENTVQKIDVSDKVYVRRRRKADHRDETPTKECVGEVVL